MTICEHTTMTDGELADVYGGGGDESNLHWHFDANGPWDWADACAEGLRIMGLWRLFGDEPVSRQSPIGNLLAGVAAASAHGAFAAVAAALGVGHEALELAVAEWYEDPAVFVSPVTPERLMEAISSQQHEIDFTAACPREHLGTPDGALNS